MHFDSMLKIYNYQMLRFKMPKLGKIIYVLRFPRTRHILLRIIEFNRDIHYSKPGIERNPLIENEIKEANWITFSNDWKGKKFWNKKNLIDLFNISEMNYVNCKQQMKLF